MNAPKTDTAPTAPRSPRGAGLRPRRLWIVALSILVGSALAVAAGLGLTRVRWSPPSPELVEQLLARKRYREAAREAEACLARRPDDPKLIFSLARARAGSEDWAGCIEALRKIPDWSARKGEAELTIGEALRKLNRAREAEAAYRRCIVRDPDGTIGIHARIALLKILAMEERLDEFNTLIWDIYARAPEAERLTFLAMRMKIPFEQVKPELNIATLKSLLDADPSDYQARAGLARALDHADDLAASKEQFARALAEAPDDPEIREDYMEVLRRSGDLSRLREVLAGRPAGADSRPETLKFIGLAAESRDLKAAERAFSAAVAARPNEPEYRHRLSGVLFRLGRRARGAEEATERDRLTKAIAALRDAWNEFADIFESDPTRLTPAVVLGMARACEACGWNREAAAWYREALRRSPDDPIIRAGLERVEALPQG